MTYADGFRERLISARSIKGLSQQALAEASGVAAAQVSRYESGKSLPRPEVVAKLSRALVVDFDWLLNGSGAAPAGTGLSIASGFHGDPNSVAIQLAPDLHRRLLKAAETSNRDLVSEIVSRLELSFSGDPKLTIEQRLEIADVEKKVAVLRARRSDIRNEIDVLIERARAEEHRDRQSPDSKELFSRIGQLSWDEAELKEEHSELMARLDALRGEDRPAVVDDI